MGFICETISLSSSKETCLNVLKMTVAPEQPGVMSDGEGLNWDLMFSIFSVKNFKNFSQMSVDASASGDTWGLIMEFMVPNRIWGLWEFLFIISEKCLVLAFLAAA